MDARTLSRDWSLRMDQKMYDELHRHLFPGDHDEHGAVLEAGLATIDGKQVLLARRLHKAKDGVDWLPGKRGYRMLPATYVTKRIRECRSERTVYLAVHNHGGYGSVEFSGIDLETHERGFPSLLDIMQGVPVGALVLAEDAIAGDIWTQGGRFPLREMIVVGPTRKRLTPGPTAMSFSPETRFDRQVRLFGASGQAILKKSRVAIIGLGGVGILLAEYLGRLGVGEFILVDPDRLRPINLPRMVHSTNWDAMTWLAADGQPTWVQRLAYRLAKPKVQLAWRIIKQANGQAVVRPFETSMEDRAALEAIKTCDYVFLAADSHRARLLFNALVHQYLIPGVQLGSRIRSDAATGAVDQVHTVTRWVLPHTGCLVCNEAINPARLQEESVTASMLKRQRYVDDPDVPAPSVITLNASSAAQAANDFLFHMTGLASSTAFAGYVRSHPLTRRVEMLRPRKSDDCPECSSNSESRFARGDGVPLPLVG